MITLETADAVRTALLACYQQMELVSREVALGRSLLDRALQTLNSSEENLGALPQLEKLLGAHFEQIKQLLDGTGDAEGQSQHRSGPFPFRMDPDTKVARIGERKVPLSDREYAVLELLWEQMPSPVSRSMLMERLFGPDNQNRGNAADWYIFQTRQKLKSAGCDDAEIRSVRGRGWVLELEAVQETALPALKHAKPSSADLQPAPQRRRKQTASPD